MSAPVDAAEVERLVGALRHPTLHLARIALDHLTGAWRIVILHPALEIKTGRALTECAFSLAMDALAEDGELPTEWALFAGHPGVPLGIDVDGVLWPGSIAAQRSGGGAYGNRAPILLLDQEATS